MTQSDIGIVELKACPFCRGAACVFQDDGDYFVECSECSNRTSLMDAKFEAILAWNTRDPIIMEMVEALEMMVAEKCDYMLINALGNPDEQHTIKVARTTLAKVRNPRGMKED